MLDFSRIGKRQGRTKMRYFENTFEQPKSSEASRSSCLDQGNSQPAGSDETSRESEEIDDKLDESGEQTRRTMSVHPVSIEIDKLRAGSRAVIALREDELAIWSSEDPTDNTSKLSVENSVGGMLAISEFVINSLGLSLCASDFCEKIRVKLYVRSSGYMVFGRVDLPPEATVTFESPIDRTTVAGLSSFALGCAAQLDRSH